MDRGTVQKSSVYSKNKFEKLVHLVGFIIRFHHDAQPPECQTDRTSCSLHTGHQNCEHL